METELAINHRLLTLLYDVVGPMVVYYVLWEVLVYRLPATVVEIAIAYANCWSFICHFSSQRSDNMAKKLIPFDDTDINRSGFDLSTET